MDESRLIVKAMNLKARSLGRPVKISGLGFGSGSSSGSVTKMVPLSPWRDIKSRSDV